VIGRETELAAGRRFVDDLTSLAHPLVIEGEPGIGKTTVWREIVGLAEASGARVLTSRPSEAEARLSSTGLADLLAGVDRERIHRLPDPQRAVLDAALLKTTPMARPPGPRVLYAAFSSVIASLADDGPVVLAVDDLQWLDGPSQAALEFTLRRIGSRPIGLLATIRRGDRVLPASLGRAIDETDGERVVLGPMSVAALHALVTDRLGVSLARPVLVRIAAASGGNPFYTIEIASEVIRRGELTAGEAIPVPDNLSELVAARVQRLPRRTRESLLTVAALSNPRVDLLDLAALEPAERAGLVQVSGSRATFTHPLFAAAVYTTATSRRRQAVHRRLADRVADPEERARHLALAAEGPDEGVAAALEIATDRARARGSPAAAAELMELAVGLTPPEHDGQRRHRMLAASEHAFHAGDLSRARTLAEQVRAASAAGRTRGHALRILGEIRYHDESFEEAIPLFEQALAEIGDDPHAIDLHVDLAYAHVNLGNIPATPAHAAAAVELARSSGDDGLHAVALAVSAIVASYQGGPIDRDVVERALSLEDPDRRTVMPMRPSLIGGILLNWDDDVERSAAVMGALRRRTIERGEESDLPLLAAQYAMALRRAGRMREALEVVTEGYEIARMLGSPPAQRLTLGERCYGRATIGDVVGARLDAAESARLASAGGSAFVDLWNWAAVAFLEWTEGNALRASEALAPLAGVIEARGWCDPISAMFLPDEVESLIALGQLDRAEVLTGLLGANGRDQRRNSTLAIAARCEALIRAARGDLPGAASRVEDALAHESERIPLALGRTLLVKGQIERRAKRKRAARDALARAADLFESIGAVSWAERARAELERTGLRRSRSRELTPTELRVAELATEGLTTRRIAETVFLSPKSVEANLAQIYAKLDIGSRAELGRAMAQRSRESPVSSPPLDS
jgi:DNA-binding CsgD family transcriptional regulator